VYAESDENGVHAHPVADHLLLVLDGEATFLDAGGNETVIGVYEGMMVPRGTAYALPSSGLGNSVMVRVGAPTDSQLAAAGSVTFRGVPSSILSASPSTARKRKAGRPPTKGAPWPANPIPGRFFTS
jgi:hypothetical protein